MIPRLLPTGCCALVLLGAGGVPVGGPGETVEYAVVVHRDNPLEDLSLAGLKEVFRIDQRHWREGGTIHLALPKTGTATHRYLLASIYDKSERELARYWLELVFQGRIPRRPRHLASSAVMLEYVRRRRGAIAVLPAGDLGRAPRVKVLSIMGKRSGQEGYPLREQRRD